jgi:hypothetical protein
MDRPVWKGSVRPRAARSAKRVVATSWSAFAAAAWSLGYGVLALYWWGGGAGFPYGVGNDPAARISILGSVTQSTAAPSIAGLALVGSLVGLAMATDRGRGAERVLIAMGIAAAVSLALLIPDYRVFVLVAYTPIALLGAPLGLDPAALLEVVDVAMLNQLACIGGGLIWAAATLAYWRRTSNPCPRCGRGDALASAMTPAAATRWGRRATYVAISVPIVYALTRYVWALGIPIGISEELYREGRAVGLWYFGAALASLAVMGAILTLGLIRHWGEVFPRWLPIIGGRCVPLPLAIVPPSLVAVLVTNAGLMYWRMTFTGGFPIAGIQLTLEDSWAALAPELLWPLWGVALGAATAAYYIRRRGGCPRCGRPGHEAKAGLNERESGSGGRIRTYDQAVNSRPLYH